jgi:hypothetical protein
MIASSGNGKHDYKATFQTPLATISHRELPFDEFRTPDCHSKISQLSLERGKKSLVNESDRNA